MNFKETQIKGAFVIDLELHEDRRGFFARTFCAKEFEAHSLTTYFPQCNLSFNRTKGTLRGMHYQVSPSKETKLVRCTRGAIYDVIIDLRPKSPTYLTHIAVELTAQNHRALYVPEQCAHGFQSLTDDTEVFYQMGDFYNSKYDAGARYDDPTFGIEWPLPVSEISEKDRTWPEFDAFELMQLSLCAT